MTGNFHFISSSSLARNEEARGRPLPSFMSKPSSSLILAAATVAAATTIAYAFSTRTSSGVTPHSSHHFRVPPELLNSDCGYKQELILAVHLALEAGKNMTEHYQSKGTADENIESLDISTKSCQSDFATAIDIKNENFIAGEIKKAFPDHKIIGEEDTGTGTIPTLTTEPTWIIDPIDGTTNFASGLPLSCVSIGLCFNGQPEMGVVFAPMTNELYIAVRNYGAFRNGIRLLGCTGKKASTSLEHAVVCFEFGYSSTQKGIDKMVGAVKRLLQHGVRTTRTLGSGVLDLCYVACGRMDIVYTGMAEEGWKPWDYCAGLVVAMESGCEISHLEKRNEDDVDASNAFKKNYEFNLYSTSMICGVNRDLVEETRKIVLGH